MQDASKHLYAYNMGVIGMNVTPMLTRKSSASRVYDVIDLERCCKH